MPCKQGITVELSCSPEHANTYGDEHADQLAKEAAQEAKDEEDLQAIAEIGSKRVWNNEVAGEMGDNRKR